MLFPTLNHEKSLFSQGYRVIAGIDEVGRGAWAGPIVAAAFIITPDNITRAKKIKVRDSKLLSPKQRTDIFHALQCDFNYAIGIVDSTVIDNKGITFANQLSMARALEALYANPEFILCDGRGFTFPNNFKNIIDGDAKVYCIAAASIVAKIIRDAIMDEWHKIYYMYGFNAHKGYGTKKHHQMIQKHGICSIHRRSYAPIRELLSQ